MAGSSSRIFSDAALIVRKFNFYGSPYFSSEIFLIRNRKKVVAPLLYLFPVHAIVCILEWKLMHFVRCLIPCKTKRRISLGGIKTSRDDLKDRTFANARSPSLLIKLYHRNVANKLFRCSAFSNRLWLFIVYHALHFLKPNLIARTKTWFNEMCRTIRLQL